MNEPPKTHARRQFLATTAAICGGAATASASAATGAVSSLMPGFAPGAGFDAARFRDCLGSRFDVQAIGGAAVPVSMTLGAVSDAPFAAIGTSRAAQAFSIDLVAAQGAFPQDTYAVSHPRLGEFVALLVPSADGRTLTGVFQRFA